MPEGENMKRDRNFFYQFKGKILFDKKKKIFLVRFSDKARNKLRNFFFYKFRKHIFTINKSNPVSTRTAQQTMGFIAQYLLLFTFIIVNASKCF